MPSVIFSLEMGRNEIAMRLLSAEARVALRLKADPDFAGAGGGRTV
jgi:replicative DNA helicase